MLRSITHAGSYRKQLGRARHVPTGRFIPDGDSAFASKARNFAETILQDPARFHVSADDAQRLNAAVQAFRDALARSYSRFARNMRTTMLKDQARAEAEKIVRKYVALIRVNDQIAAADKVLLGMRERRKPVRRASGLTMAPDLRFIGSTGENGMLGHKHILKFRDHVDGNKPQGAARLELFVELVDPEEPLPSHPGELSGGRLWYLRSYTRSPIQVDFPTTQQPMRVVYWARWADAKGNVGPFCATVKARVEGWDGGGRKLPKLLDARQREQTVIITSAMKELPGYAQHDDERGEEVAGLLASGDA